MRRLGIFTLLFSLMFVLTTCSTLDEAAVRKTNKVAVAIVGVDKYLQYSSGFAVGSLVQRLAESEDFDLQPIAEKLHNKTFGTYTKIMPFTLMDEEKVINTSAYKDFTLFEKESYEERFKKNSMFISAKDYMKYRPEFLNRGHRKKLFKAMPEEADAMLMVGLSYWLKKQTSMVPGMTKAKAMAHLNMELVKPNGKKIMDIEKKAYSDEAMEIVFDWAILKPEKIRPLCVTATNKVMVKAEKFVKDELSG